MSVREIRWLGDPVLREKCRDVAEIDAGVLELVSDLQETMYAAEGVGLAAPQIGIPLRVFVYDIREPEEEPGVLINPVLIESAGVVREPEGCLSIPGLTEVVQRAETVAVKGILPDGSETTIRAAGLLSRCLQHECDHLDGVLFFDRVSPLKRKMLLARWRKMDHDERLAAASG
ncbi:MAG: peptide deformylase [Gemmatimonadota bacterium]